MSSALKQLLLIGFIWLTTAHSVHAQHREDANASNQAITEAQTTSYCEVLKDPERFRNRMIRVRALYQTDFEESIITAPSCYTPLPMTWVSFDEQWESRSKRSIRHAISNVKWRIQTDVVFVGLFKADGHYGHMDRYPYSIEVYKVEAIRPSGSFRAMPE